jgi:hypothetical protein
MGTQAYVRDIARCESLTPTTRAERVPIWVSWWPPGCRCPRDLS